MELVSLTYLLQRHRIPYRIDRSKDIILTGKDEKRAGIISLLRSFYRKMKCQQLPIYVLNDKQVKGARNLPVFKIEALAQDLDLSGYDALVFTSQNAVKALNSFNSVWKKIPAYAIAPQTAKSVKHLGGKLALVGKKKHGNEFASELFEPLKGKKVLFVRGTKVVSDLHDLLNANGVTCDEAVVYQTLCREYKTPINLPKHSTIIFSSPSTVDCFFKNVAWDESFTAVAIGETTAQYFPAGITPLIAHTTSLGSCVSKAIEVYTAKR